MAGQDLLTIVWGETRGLAAPGAPNTLSRLYAVVAAMAVEAQKRRLDGRMRHSPPPAVGSEDEAPYKQMSAVVNQVDAGTWDGDALPRRAVIWEALESGIARYDNTLPKSAAWILEPGVSATHLYRSGQGPRQRVYGLFESATDDAAVNEMPLISGSTGTGVVKADRVPAGNWLAWLIGLGGVALLIVGGVAAEFAGSSLHDARLSLTTSDPARRADLIHQVANTCIEYHTQFPAQPQVEFCKALVGQNYALPKADDKGLISWDAGAVVAVIDAAKSCDGSGGKVPGAAHPDCAMLWDAALTLTQGGAIFADKDQRLKEGKSAFNRFLAATSALLTARSNDAGTVSVLAPVVAILLGITGLMIGLGLGTKGRVAGIWIDGRNRVSLARGQVTLWTIVALGGYAAMALFNVGALGLEGLLGDEPVSAFPTIPAAIASALGIAVSSTMLSALILGIKTNATANQQANGFDAAATPSFAARGATFFGSGTTGIDTKPDASQASITDIFMGEEDANADTVDVSRLQNVVITLTLVLGYLATLVVAVSRILPERLFVHPMEPYFPSLPTIGAAAAALLFVSHATYLVAKSHDTPPAKPGDGQTPH
jgi:hypothetical protein